MATYATNHYDTPATYVSMTTTPRRAYTLMHYEEAISPTMPTVSACLHVAAMRRLDVHDRIRNTERNLWVPMANILYMERQDRNV
jgi:hypothetical protein